MLPFQMECIQINKRLTRSLTGSYYTPVLFGDNNATSQYKLLTSLVNTVVIGNYSVPKNDVAVAGILALGTFNGTKVNLLPYFNGGLSSSNRGGSSGMAVNFLDDGGAEPLKANKPANGTDSSQLWALAAPQKIRIEC